MSSSEGLSFIFSKIMGSLACVTGWSTGHVTSEALCGHSGRQLKVTTDKISSRRNCSFFHPQCLEKCLAYERWLISAGQINEHVNKCLIQMGYMSSANLNALLLWFSHFIELSLLQAQTNIPHSMRKRTTSISLGNGILLHRHTSPLVCPTSPNLFTRFHILLLVVVFLRVYWSCRRKQKNLEENWVDSK